MKLFTRQKPTAGQNTSGGSGNFQAETDEGPIGLTTMIGYLARAVPEDWTSIHEVCEHASSSESNAKEAIRAVRHELRSGDPPIQLSAARLWAIMLRNSPDMFLSESASRKFLDTVEELLQGRLTSPVVQERLLEVLGAATYASSSKADPELELQGLWRRFKPFDKPDGGLPFDKDDPIFGPSMLSRQVSQRGQAPMVEHQAACVLPDTNRSTTTGVHENETKINAPEEQDSLQRERVTDEGPAELTRMIGYLTATAAEDWTLVLEVCDRVSSSESNAKEAVRALRREFKYGEPPAQLSAARLWAIMLHNSSETFIFQSTSHKFLDTLEYLLQSSRTSPAVRGRLLEVIAAAAYASGTTKDPGENRDGFKGLWRRVKPFDKPDEGEPFDRDNAIFGPLNSGRLSAYKERMAQNQETTPLVDTNTNTNPSTPQTDHMLHNGDYQLHAGPASVTHRGQQQQRHQPQQYSPAVASDSASRGHHSGTDDTIFDPLMSTDLSDSATPTVLHRQSISPPHATPPSEPNTDEIPPPRYSSIFPDVRRSWHRLAGWRTSIRQQRAKG